MVAGGYRERESVFNIPYTSGETMASIFSYSYRNRCITCGCTNLNVYFDEVLTSGLIVNRCLNMRI